MEWLKPVIEEVEKYAKDFCQEKNLSLVQAVQINCGTGAGITDLRNLIIRLVETELLIEIPKKIVDLENKLQHAYGNAGPRILMKREFNNHLNEVGIQDPESAEGRLALHTLHNLGIFFWNEATDCIFVNPEKIPKISGEIVRKYEITAKKDGFILKSDFTPQEFLEHRTRQTLLRHRTYLGI